VAQIYGVYSFTGLYSFEFVDKNRNTITEIFFMIPPKSKSVSEPTRSTTVPTLGGNFNNDAGNATKNITLAGELYFPYVGSPDNPVARDNTGLTNTIDGLNEFFKLRWMLIRYRDYTMTRKGRMTVPDSVMNLSPQITALYENVSKKVREKVGALYDEIQVIFHDYDMDDHFYCRVDNFSSNQTDSKHIAISYTINIECYEPDTAQKTISVTQVKKSTNENVDIINTQFQDIGFSTAFTDIQAEIGYNSNFISSSVEIENIIDMIATENENIQAGKSTAMALLPTYCANLKEAVRQSLESFIDTFLSTSQQTSYAAGTITIDEIINFDLLAFYNSLQKVKIATNQLSGVLNSIVVQEELRYYSNANDYLLTTDQFDSGDENKVENTSTFKYYTVMEGDTARIIALRELRDAEKFISILKINNITENDFIDGTLIGERIKVPMLISSATRGDDNLVYESDDENIDAFLYGSDIALGVNDEMLISSSGDLLGKTGIDNAYDNIENRLANNKGSLNVFNPNWGTVAIDDSNAPLMVKIDRYLTDVTGQIQSDPRVESVKINLDKLEWKGETISVPYTIFFIGSEQSREVVVNG